MIGWFICPYKQMAGGPFGRPIRYCAMNDYSELIFSEGGNWSESEVLGGYAVVKVRASSATLIEINKATGFVRIPLTRLDDPISSLTAIQRTVLRNRLKDMGYSDAEIIGGLGDNIGDKTLGEVLRFAAQRRLKPRWDEGNQQIALDGEFQSCRPIYEVDEVVQ